nr:MAG TPA: hypothetical protein [Caudoviricetes sp.]
MNIFHIFYYISLVNFCQHFLLIFIHVNVKIYL